MIKKSIQLFFFVSVLSLTLSIFYIYRQLIVVTGERTEKISFEIKSGESASTLAQRLKENSIIKSDFFFKLYLKHRGLDKKIQAGIFQIEPPFTIPRVAAALASPENNERIITIIPGWDLRDIAEYFIKERLVGSTSDFYALVGKPANNLQFDFVNQYDGEFYFFDDKSPSVSLEGYLAPETYRIYKNEELQSIVHRLIAQTNKEFTPEMQQEIQKRQLSVPEILTMASIIEKEVKTPEDRKMVSDLFWRRVNAGMGLQADSTVHYLSGREGDVFTKAKERQIDSLYNTYKYRGLPPGPISNPSVSSIMAALYPEKNDYWYFLTTHEGEVKYAKTLEEHNANVARYLR